MYDSEMDSKVRVAACFADPLNFDTFAAPTQLRSQALFHILVLSMPKGRNLDVLKSVQSSEGRNNGYEAWRRIVQIYEPASANRPMGLFAKVPLFTATTAEGWLDELANLGARPRLAPFHDQRALAGADL